MFRKTEEPNRNGEKVDNNHVMIKYNTSGEF